ncbi:hypothetical protein F383_31344 [Gossypium arboreum]|nr:hypothetical protein F383_31344 [Gossypium arboreum]
MFEPNL